MKILFKLLIIILFTSCEKPQMQEDIDLMKMISTDQERKNNDFLNSMRAQLEYFGAPADEAEYYNNSGSLRQMRQELLQNEASEGLLVFADTLDQRHSILEETGLKDVIEYEWTDSQEELKEFYKNRLQNKTDSLAYYQFLYIVLKKEHALHMFNARMMAH